MVTVSSNFRPGKSLLPPTEAAIDTYLLVSLGSARRARRNRSGLIDWGSVPTGRTGNSRRSWAVSRKHVSLQIR